MALSIASLHEPLNGFFLSRFGTGADDQLLFRFDKFGSVVSDQSFTDPNNPASCLPALATERFSDLVNHVPVEGGDAASVVLSEDTIDSTYFFRMLSPSLPVFPDGATDEQKQTILDGFSITKAEAVKLWANLTLESLSGLLLQYKPSLATPEFWYDMSKNDAWTSHSWQISDSSGPLPAPDPSTYLWRLKLDDLKLREILAIPDTVQPLGPTRIDLATRVLEVRANPGLLAAAVVRQPAIVARPAPIGAARMTIQPVGRIAVLAAADRVAVAEPPLPPAAPSEALHTELLQDLRTLDVSKRLLVNQYISRSAPTAPAATSSISVSFDYCLVGIRRPWYVDAFVNDTSWYLPTKRRGEITTGAAASTLSLLPVGFVAIRNLNIEANWTQQDIDHAAGATDFGPFRISSEIVNGKLSHPGLQVIGWILQKMPVLPPNDDPALGPAG